MDNTWLIHGQCMINDDWWLMNMHERLTMIKHDGISITVCPLGVSCTESYCPAGVHKWWSTMIVNSGVIAKKMIKDLALLTRDHSTKQWQPTVAMCVIWARLWTCWHCTKIKGHQTCKTLSLLMSCWLAQAHTGCTDWLPQMKHSMPANKGQLFQN